MPCRRPAVIACRIQDFHPGVQRGPPTIGMSVSDVGKRTSRDQPLKLPDREQMRINRFAIKASGKGLPVIEPPVIPTFRFNGLGPDLANTK